MEHLLYWRSLNQAAYRSSFGCPRLSLIQLEQHLGVFQCRLCNAAVVSSSLGSNVQAERLHQPWRGEKMLQERQLPRTSVKCNCLRRSADKGNAISFLLILKGSHVRPVVKKLMLLLSYHSITAVTEMSK